LSEPTLRALLLADYVGKLHDGKWVVAGIYDALFPGQIPLVWNAVAYLKIVDAPSEGKVRIDLLNPAGARMWTTTDATYKGAANGQLEIGPQLTGMQFFELGLYRLEAVLNDNVIGGVGLWLRQKPLSVEVTS